MSHVLVTDHPMGPCWLSGRPVMPKLPPVAVKVALVVVDPSEQAVNRSLEQNAHTEPG